MTTRFFEIPTDIPNDRIMAFDKMQKEADNRIKEHYHLTHPDADDKELDRMVLEHKEKERKACANRTLTNILKERAQNCDKPEVCTRKED